MIKKSTTPNKQKVLKIEMDQHGHANTVAETFKLLGPSLTLHRHQWSRAQVSQSPVAYLQAVDAWRRNQTGQIRIARDNPTVKGLPGVFLDITQKRPLCRYCGQPFPTYKLEKLKSGQHRCIPCASNAQYEQLLSQDPRVWLKLSDGVPPQADANGSWAIDACNGQFVAAVG